MTTLDSGTGTDGVAVVSEQNSTYDLAEPHTAPNYSPLPVVVASADNAWVTDIHGKRYLDMLAGYSALNFGHCNPRLIAVAQAQLSRCTLVSRAFHNDQLGPFCDELADLAGMEMVLPMNTGAEAVESGIKTARRWGHKVKGIADGQATIIVASGNFHGRTTTIISFSDDPDARDGFGPYTPGFVTVPYGDAEAIRNAIDDNTAAVLLEPIQGEGGVLIPPPGYLKQVRDICTDKGVLFIADEIQSGLGRTGTTFACDFEEVKPDMYLLGKALGGGVLPVSAVVSSREILGVLTPGTHGSTFGGNPLACAVGREVVSMLKTGEYQERARTLGKVLEQGLTDLGSHVVGIRTRGLWAGVDCDTSRTGKEVCKGLMKRGVLAKDTHGSTIRLAPPLTISEQDLAWGLEQIHDEVRQEH